MSDLREYSAENRVTSEFIKKIIFLREGRKSLLLFQLMLKEKCFSLFLDKIKLFQNLLNILKKNKNYLKKIFYFLKLKIKKY
jgi:hypothetical protein